MAGQKREEGFRQPEEGEREGGDVPQRRDLERNHGKTPEAQTNTKM